MIPGFIQVDCHRFYSVVWPRISNETEAIQSNLKRHRKHGDLPLVIYWGLKGKSRDENTIIAVSRADGQAADEHWIAPHLIID